MEAIIPIKNYELILPLGKDSSNKRLKIFAKQNSHRVKEINVEFLTANREVMHLLEGASTGLRKIRLDIGEDELGRMLDLLRNEKNPCLFIVFDPDGTAQFLGEIEGVSQLLRIMPISVAVLQSKVVQRPRRPPLTQIFRPATRR